MSRMSCISGADPYDTEERLAIQKESNEISNLPDKPILSLAEQAALVLDGYNGDKEQAAADLRTVARNLALAECIEDESPQPALAESQLKDAMKEVSPANSLLAEKTTCPSAEVENYEDF